MPKTFTSKLHRTVQCPNCKAFISYSKDIIDKEDIKCRRCTAIFSYNDGFIEFLFNTEIDVLFVQPIYSGLSEAGPFKIRVGKAAEVRFKNRFYEVYDVGFGQLMKKTDEEKFKQIKLEAVDVDKEGFVALSSSFDDSIIDQEIDIAYIAIGRDYLENVPIWHRFLQGVINSIKSKQYGMAIVESVSAFDAFLDEFLINQLMEKRSSWSSDNGEELLDAVRQMIKKYSRPKKLFHLLFYLTGKSFKDSPHNKNLQGIVELRNKIVHPKAYKFDEKELSEDSAKNALETVIKSVKWVNDTKI